MTATTSDILGIRRPDARYAARRGRAAIRSCRSINAGTLARSRASALGNAYSRPATTWNSDRST